MLRSSAVVMIATEPNLLRGASGRKVVVGALILTEPIRMKWSYGLMGPCNDFF